jgi:DNA-binding response OmpR family regulator
LLVDDDADIVEIVGEIVESQGFAVATARNGRQALEWLERAAKLPQLVLLDLMMPEIDGPQLLAVLREHASYTTIPVVIVTASRREPPRTWAFEVAGWLYKPVDHDELVSTIARVMGTPQLPAPARAGLGSARVDQFLERRRKEVDEMRRAHVAADYEHLRSLGHNLKGVGASFGFPELGEIGARIERAARARDHGSMDQVIDELAGYLAGALPPG